MLLGYDLMLKAVCPALDVHFTGVADEGVERVLWRVEEASHPW